VIWRSRARPDGLQNGATECQRSGDGTCQIGTLRRSRGRYLDRALQGRVALEYAERHDRTTRVAAAASAQTGTFSKGRLASVPSRP